MKKILCIVLLVIFVLLISGCNKQLVDLNYKFDYAIIKLPNGEIVEGTVQSWKDYEGEQLQVKINGTVYLVSSINCVLLSK
jgi:hypothetical protein